MEETAAGIAFAVVSLVGPGLGLQRLLRLPADPALVLPLGAAWAALAQALSLAAGASWLFPALVVAAALPLLRGLRLVEELPPWRALVPPALALLVLLGLTQYGGNRPAADGSFRLDPMGDQPLHAGIAWELTISWPPQVPGLAGVPLHYHYGADLVRAAAVRWARATPYGLLNGLEPTLWALGLMLALSALVRRLGGGALAAALAAWSVLASDLSFLWAPLRQAEWWSDVFRGNLLVSLAFTNPVVPALMLAAGALVALSRFEAGFGRGWLALGVAQALAVPVFKVFLGAQLGLALGLAALVLALRTRDREGMRRAAPVLLLALAALPGVAWLAGGSGGEQVQVVLAPLRMVRDSLGNLHYEGVTAAALAAAALPWLVVSLGLRLVGIGPAIGALRRGGAAAATAAALALSGWPLGLLFHAAAHDVDGRELPSAAIYFVEQSGAVLWLFTALALARWAAGPRRRRAAVLALAATLALPSTVEFAVRKAQVRPDVVPAAYLRAVRAIAADARPGDRVLQRPAGRYPPLPVVLEPQRVLYERFTPYLSQFAPAAELRRRHQALYRFFRTTDRAEALSIARSLQVRYLCLYGTDRIRFEAAGALVTLHEEPEARSYRFVDTPPSSPQGDAAAAPIR